MTAVRPQSELRLGVFRLLLVEGITDWQSQRIDADKFFN